jgi:CheY-like chemotaxis protein
MDICMPDIDGVEALKLIRTHEQTAGLRPSCMIAMTAHAFQEIQADLQEQGFNTILTKPFTRDDLLTTLKRRNNLPTFVHPPIESVEFTTGIQSGADVKIPSSLTPLIPVLLEKLNREHATIVKAVERSDFANVSRLCHANKGVVGMYGFHKLSSMYHGLEQAAENEALGSRIKELEELTGYLSNLSEQYGYRHNESVE